MERCSRWGEQERDRMEIFLGSHHFLLIMKHTPPPLIFPASAVLSFRKNRKVIRRSYSGVRDRGSEPCFRQTKDVTVPNVPLETCPGSKVVHLIFQGLDICEQNTASLRAEYYIVASWLLRHQRRQVLITNFQDAICKCVYVDCVGFISDVFAIVVQISDVTLA